MKLIRHLTYLGLVLAAGSLAHGQTTILIVGSNGDRGATQQALSNLFASGTNWTFQGDKGSASKSGATVTNLANATNSNYGAWNGKYNGTNVIVKVSFIGAAGAVGALATPQKARFVVTSGTGSGTVKSPYDPTADEGTDYNLDFANFGFSTNFQETTPFSGGSYDDLIEETVGVSPMVFIASPGFPANNITSQQAQNLYGSGSLPVSLLSGTSADATKIVYALGRNSDAGQRYETYGEIGLGTASTVKVWQPTIVGQLTDPTTLIKYSGTATAQRLWPIETVSGVNSGSRGNGGYDSGSNLAPLLTVVTGSNVYTGKDTGSTTPNFTPYPLATAGYYIGYLTVGDYNTRILPFSPGSVLLKYNGVDFSAENVRQGKYTFWVYNRILKRSEGLGTGIVNSFHDSLRDQIKNFDATANGGLRENDPANPFAVERGADGGLVTPR